MLRSHLAGMTAISQWFVWRLAPDGGKFTKTPCYPDGRPQKMDAQKPENWMTYDQARETVALLRCRFDGCQYALGFMLTEDCGYWFLDIDGCVDPVANTWTQFALDCYTNLPGAFLELSSSGTGLHFIGRSQKLPEHRTRPTKEWLQANPGNNLEFYTKGRGIAFGLSGQANGSADTDHTPMATWLATNPFKADAEVVTLGVGGDGPRADWRGPTDDSELLRRAFAAKSGASLFGAKATFADLWTRNVPVLAAAYPSTSSPGYAESEADMALAAHLAFWTGCDAARMERLMRQSNLARPKWDEHRTYLRELTIGNVCKRQETVCRDKEVVARLDVAVAPAQSKGRMEYLAMINDAEDDAQLRNEVIPLIAADRDIVSLDRDFLAAALRARFKEWLFPVSIGDCREMLRVRVLEGDDCAVPEWANSHVYVLAEDTFFCLKTSTALSRTAFCAQFNRMMPQRPNGDREDAAKWCLERWNMATVGDSMYLPGQDPVFQHEGRWYANLYSPAHIPEVAQVYSEQGTAAINAFLRHLFEFCGRREDVYLNMVDFAAWVTQNPGKKCRYAPLLKGMQGDGKSMLLAAIAAAMGRSNVGSVSANLLCADFNDWAEGSCVTGFEEMMVTGRKRYSVANSLKEPISNDTLTINRKGRAGKSIVNVTNYIGFTNFVDAVPLEDSDRRWWVIFSPFSKLEDLAKALNLTRDGLADHYTKIFDSFVTCRGEWRKFLTEYQVSANFRPNAGAPDTAEKAEMRVSGEDAVEAVARQVIESGAVGVTSTVLSSSALTSAMRTICVQDGLDMPKTSSVNHMLSRLGFSQHPKVIKWDGRTHRVWWKRGQMADASNDGVRDALEMSKIMSQSKMVRVG